MAQHPPNFPSRSSPRRKTGPGVSSASALLSFWVRRRARLRFWEDERSSCEKGTEVLYCQEQVPNLVTKNPTGRLCPIPNVDSFQLCLIFPPTIIYTIIYIILPNHHVAAHQMDSLQRFRAFITRRRPQQSTTQSTGTETHPAPTMFRGVGTVNIIGGTFIIFGKLQLLPHRALLYNCPAVPSIDPRSTTHEGMNAPSTTGTQTSDIDERRQT